ncbi:Tox-REase-5 domain-containing protein [Streptomyces sp. NPDC087525]|uniref:Tox-REase-5 domain-containing protein n=1 Tax=Streptomyces sp. NPDC087525 TaxID=3365793 RepID=UPI00381BFB6E
MSEFGGVPAYGGSASAPGGGRRELPRALGAARSLVYVLFGATVLGGLGLFGSAIAADALGGELLGLALYAAAPGVVGQLLARRVRSGGVGVWGGLVAVQLWLILGGLTNVGDGSGHGFTQLFLPVLILWFLTRPESREWFRLPDRERDQRRRGRPTFSLSLSLSRLTTRRRDRGQSALEYAGLITLVAAIIVALVLGGISGRIAGGLQSAVCSITGTACPSPGDAGESADAATGGTGGSTGGTTGGSNGGESNGGSTSGSTGGSWYPATDGPGRAGDTYPESGAEPEAEYDVPAVATDPDANGEDDGANGEGDGANGEGDGEEEDCGGWGFFGCAWDRGTQVVKGVFVDGVWGDLTGIGDLFTAETWSGMADYGRQLGDQWLQGSEGATDKWKDGDYLGALGDWGGASLDTVLTVGDDVFVGDEVRERWNNGEKTRAVTDVVWNVGSLFIPGYDVAKVVGKVGKLGKLGKVAEDVAKAASDAGDAARRARKAAEAGDVEGARKAAKEADEAADAAEDQARKTGCVIASGLWSPRPLYGFNGVAGSGTGVLAGSGTHRVILAEAGCDEEAKAKAKEARDQERAAHLAQKRAEEPERAAKAELEKKKWPEPAHGDTSDPRNYNPPDWAGDLKSPDLGSADKGDGFWASRDRNPKPNWKNESWLRYQEQITGTARGKEYVVPHPKEGKPAVEYDGWDSGRQTFLEAKNGYDSYLSKTDKGTLTESGKQKFLAEARGQVEASGGRPVEWHFSDPDVAKAARKAFREEGLPIKVVHTGQKPAGGPKKPEAFG